MTLRKTECFPWLVRRMLCPSYKCEASTNKSHLPLLNSSIAVPLLSSLEITLALSMLNFSWLLKQRWFTRAILHRDWICPILTLQGSGLFLQLFLQTTGVTVVCTEEQGVSLPCSQCSLCWPQLQTRRETCTWRQSLSYRAGRGLGWDRTGLSSDRF